MSKKTIEELKAKLQVAQAREAASKRKIATRIKVLLGSCVLKNATPEQISALTRPSDTLSDRDVKFLRSNLKDFRADVEQVQIGKIELVERSADDVFAPEEDEF